MGYRSDVRCLIYGEPDIVQAFWTRLKLENNAAVNSWFATDIKRYDVKGVRELHATSVIDLNVQSIKWYPDYEEVDAWQRIIDDIACEQPGTEGLSYEYAEVGEEYNDIKYENGGRDVQGWLGISTSIVSDMPSKLKESANEQDAESQG